MQPLRGVTAVGLYLDVPGGIEFPFGLGLSVSALSVSALATSVSVSVGISS